jgi:cobalt-zinc-cadmium efflux system protein
MHDDICENAGPSLLIRFVWSLILNASLAVGEIVMSLVTGSTALLADGLNNLDDTAALILSIYSERIAKQPPDKRHTFGHERMDVVAGFAKGCFLLIAAVLIVYKAFVFLLAPVEIPGVPVLITASLALVVNLASAVWLKQDACHSLNAKGTYLCMVYDAVGSVAVMISAVLTLLLGFVYFDIVASVVIVFFMVKSGSGLLRESINIFMQSAPDGFDYDVFEQEISSIPNVSGVGDIHVWCHAPGEHHLTCRVNVEITDFCDCDRIVKAVEGLCRTNFNIQHCTIQLVYDSVALNRFCKLPANS